MQPRSFRHTFVRLLRDEAGNTLPEYAIVLALLTIISMTAFKSFSNAAANATSANANRMVTSGLGNYGP